MQVTTILLIRMITAKYEFVYASGYDSRIVYKNIDLKYNSNRIILLADKIKYYKGTSYLSLLSMLNNK